MTRKRRELEHELELQRGRVERIARDLADERERVERLTHALVLVCDETLDARSIARVALQREGIEP